jgi:hypothetical protein
MSLLSEQDWTEGQTTIPNWSKLLRKSSPSSESHMRPCGGEAFRTSEPYLRVRIPRRLTTTEYPAHMSHKRRVESRVSETLRPTKSNCAVCHSDPHHRWAGPPRNQGAPHRSRSKVSFGAPPSLISSRNVESLPVPQVAFRTLKPSGDSSIRTTHKSDRPIRCPQRPTTSSTTQVPPT